MTKKVIRNFGRENGNFFLEKRHSEILVCEIFSVSPNWAPGLRLWQCMPVYPIGYRYGERHCYNNFAPWRPSVHVEVDQRSSVNCGIRLWTSSLHLQILKCNLY